MYNVEKTTCLGVLEEKEIRDKDNETGLKRERSNGNVNYSAFPYTRLHSLSFALKYLPC